MSSTSGSKPTLILVHGTWHSPAFFKPLIDVLGDSYPLKTVDLPTVGDLAGSRWHEHDTIAARTVVKAELELGNDVVLVAHSWGGSVSGNCFMGLTKAEREKEGQKGGVVRLIMMAAFIRLPGPPGELEIFGMPDEFFNFEGDTFTLRNPIDMLYQDLPRQEAEHWESLLRPSTARNFSLPGYAGWKDVPVNYLLCENDQTIPPVVQEGMIQMAKENGADIQVTRFQSGHSPFLKDPNFVATWIKKCVSGDELI